MKLTGISVDNFRQIYVNGDRSEPNLSVNAIIADSTAGRKDIIMDNPYFLWATQGHGATKPDYNRNFFIENVLELLDSLGEWYLDRATDTLYYWPKAGESLTTAEVYVPVVENLIEIKGSSKTNKAHHIIIEGLSMSHTSLLRTSTQGSYALQASMWQDGPGQNEAMVDSNAHYQPTSAIVITNARYITIKNNNLSKLGGCRILMEYAESNSTIASNKITDVSDGGITVGRWSHLTLDLPEEEVVKDNYILNNYI